MLYNITCLQRRSSFFRDSRETQLTRMEEQILRYCDEWVSERLTQRLLCPQINTCYTVPCASTGENECLWTDWLLDNSLNGEQARQYACIRRSDTTCSWYRGGPPPEKDFLDIADPWRVNSFSSISLVQKSWETFPALAYVAQMAGSLRRAK